MAAYQMTNSCSSLIANPSRAAFSGSDQGVGAVQRYTWKGWLPYRLVFDMRVTRVDPLVALEGEASGDVEGAGRWSFSTDGRNLTVVL